MKQRTPRQGIWLTQAEYDELLYRRSSGQGYREIAMALNCSEKTIYRHLQRGPSASPKSPMARSPMRFSTMEREEVSRGLPVPLVKKMYLVKDAAREARRLGIPFGRLADPVGSGAERCLAVCAAVTTDDGHTLRAFDFAVAASKAIWSQGIDVATDRGLLAVTSSVGISLSETRAALANLSDGLALAESNRMLMIEAGVWGVPSFRSGAFVTWGQDRLELLRQQLGLQAT